MIRFAVNLLNRQLISVTIACILFVVGFALTPALAGGLAGVTLPDSMNIGGKDCQLVGMGLREATIFKIKAYVSGLYMESATSDPARVIGSEQAKGMIVHFIYKKISARKLKNEYAEKIEENTPKRSESLNRRIDQFLNMFTDPALAGDEFVYTYVPGTGTTIAIAGKKKETIPGPDFMMALFRVWFGDKPFDVNLKKGLLGRE